MICVSLVSLLSPSDVRLVFAFPNQGQFPGPRTQSQDTLSALMFMKIGASALGLWLGKSFGPK